MQKPCIRKKPRKRMKHPYLLMQKHTNVSKKSEALIAAIREKISGLNKARKEFMLTIFMLFMELRGRYNFLNMARYGDYSEQTYRNHFTKEFDFKTFNKELIKQKCSSHVINAFDPSYTGKR